MTAGADHRFTGDFTTDDAVEIAYTRWPAGADLPPVVLHHGFTGDAERDWLDTGIVAALVAGGRTVVAPDARGHGRSGKPHRADAYGEARMARDLSELIDALGVPQIDLLGFSMGAVVSLIAASQEPRIRRLVVVGIGGRVVEPDVDPGRLPPDVVADAILGEVPDGAVDPRAQMFADGLAGRDVDRVALAMQARAMHAEPVPVGRIGAPTLVVAGDVDPFAFRADLLAAAIPGARFEVVEGDHGGCVTNPRFLDLVGEFLGG